MGKCPDNLQTLLSLGTLQTYGAGTEVFSAGWPNQDFFVLTSGIVGLSYALENGDEVLFLLNYPGHLISSFMHDLSKASPVSAVAMTRCFAYRVPVARLHEAVLRDPTIGIQFEQMLMTQVSLRTAALAGSLALSPVVRLRRQINELRDVIGKGLPEGETAITLPIKDEHLASLSGVSLRQFSRVKKALGKLGIMRFSRRRVVLLK
jgi:CRP-like cAMP-binding protein